MMRFSVQIGYYFSAFTVDKPWMGRVRLQSMVSLHALALLNACLPVNMSFARIVFRQG